MSGLFLIFPFKKDFKGAGSQASKTREHNAFQQHAHESVSGLQTYWETLIRSSCHELKESAIHVIAISYM